MTDTDTTEGESLEINQRQLAALASDLVRRAGLSARMGESFGHLEERDYWDTLGYPEPQELDVHNHRAMYERGDIAETIIEAPAGATWNAPPDVVDDGTPEDEDDVSPFEADVQTLFEEKGLLKYLYRADVLQRMGRYGILLIGYDDGAESFDEPLNEGAFRGDPEEDILYLQPFSEEDVEIEERYEDITDEKFGDPKLYSVDFGDEHPQGAADVHESRVFHIAEGALEDEVYGKPALRAVYNLLMDKLKVVGGSAEGYWRNADRKYVANLQQDSGPLKDEDELQDQVEELINDLRPTVYSRGLDIDTIDGDDTDPSGPYDAIMELISGQTRIPKRKLLGTERGDLASTQDEMAFVQMAEERRQKFGEPEMFRPIIGHWVDLGIVSDPEGGTYDVEWAHLFELTDLEEAELRQRLAKAVKDAAPMGDPSALATPEELRELIFDWEPERGSEVESDGTGGDIPTDPEADEPLDEDDEAVQDVFDEIFGDGDTDVGVEGDGESGVDVEVVADGGDA